MACPSNYSISTTEKAVCFGGREKEYNRKKKKMWMYLSIAAASAFGLQNCGLSSAYEQLNNPQSPSNNTLNNPIQISEVSLLHCMVLRSQTARAKQDDIIGKELARNPTLKDTDLHLKDSHTWYKCQTLLTPPKPLRNKTKHKNWKKKRS